MTDEENKLWREWVSIAYTGSLPLSKAILAADAEIKRLQEAVEWASWCVANNQIELNFGRKGFEAELRRRAKEG